MALGLHVGGYDPISLQMGNQPVNLCGCALFFGEKPWCVPIRDGFRQSLLLGENHVANIVERLKSLKENKGHYVSCIIFHTTHRLSILINCHDFFLAKKSIGSQLGLMVSDHHHIKVWTASITDVSTTRCWRGWVDPNYWGWMGLDDFWKPFLVSQRCILLSLD